MATVALATCRELPHLDADEAPLVRALAARGITPAAIPWDAGDEAFFAQPLTVIRSTWDYTERVDAFVAWAARIEAQGRIYNKASVVRWNTHKRYLLELEKEGHAIVPTLLLAKSARVDVAATLAERGWTRGAVVKPAVSAGSRDTVRVGALGSGAGAKGARASTSGDEFDGTGDGLAAAQALVDALVPERDMLVQPFVDGVAGGELSLIYVDGGFTHAVNKVPVAGDFRSQPEFGSRVERVDPPAAARRAADDILRTVGGELLYARADFVIDHGRPLLMELELVEPSLYFAFHDAAADALAQAIARRL